MPAQGIGSDVFPDAIEGFFVTDDVFVIIALPDGRARCATMLVNPFSNDGFVSRHDGTDGTRCRAPETIIIVGRPGGPPLRVPGQFGQTALDFAQFGLGQAPQLRRLAVNLGLDARQFRRIPPPRRLVRRLR